MTVTPLIRSQVDDAGRMVRCWIPSLTTPGHTYEMVRISTGWAHTDNSCGAWIRGIDCAHIEALHQYDREARP